MLLNCSMCVYGALYSACFIIRKPDIQGRIYIYIYIYIYTEEKASCWYIAPVYEGDIVYIFTYKIFQTSPCKFVYMCVCVCVCV